MVETPESLSTPARPRRRLAVILTFLGTRGEIDARSRLHRRHSVLAVSSGGKTIFVDCGKDWLSTLPTLRPNAILVTHAHPDHAGGLTHGAPCPVYAARETLRLLPRALDAHVLPRRARRRVCGLAVEAFPVVHSLRAPAVGYRLTAGRLSLFYVPDVVAIVDERAALAGVALYIGDGATITRPILRRRDNTLIGHCTIREQLEWCARQRVPRAIFTHCGSQIVRGDQRTLAALVRRMGREFGVQARIAHDGMRVVLRQAPSE